MPRLLNTEERNAIASNYPAWKIQQQRDAMSRTFLFANFSQFERSLNRPVT